MMLHAPIGTVHRDRAMDGLSSRRSQKELEADYFASVFLLPEKQVRRRFEENFLTSKFKLDDDTAFALCSTSLTTVLGSMKSPRAISRALAQAVTYGGRTIDSLTSMFHVSSTTMAMRLEELELVAI